MDGHEPATKADVKVVEQHVELLGGRVDGLAGRVDGLAGRVDALTGRVGVLNEHVDMLRSEMHHVFDDLKESMRDTQTELLKAFYGFVQSTDLKLKDCESSSSSLKERLHVVERRLTELERKVNFPDQPTL